LKKGEPQSKKWQLFIDNLIEGTLVIHPAEVTPNPSDSETGYGAFAHLREVKERVNVEQGIMWVTCPKDNQAHRISNCVNCNSPEHVHCKEQIKKYMEA